MDPDSNISKKSRNNWLALETSKVSLKTSFIVKSQVSWKNGTFSEIFESKDLEIIDTPFPTIDFSRIKYINEGIESRSGEGGFFQSMRYNSSIRKMGITQKC